MLIMKWLWLFSIIWANRLSEEWQQNIQMSRMMACVWSQPLINRRSLWCYCISRQCVFLCKRLGAICYFLMMHTLQLQDRTNSRMSDPITWKLSYRKDDRAMRLLHVYGCPENFQDVHTKFEVRSWTNRSWDNKGYFQNIGPSLDTPFKVIRGH